MIPLIPQDKANHAVYGAVLCALGVLAAQALGFPPSWGIALPGVVGALKEARDRMGYGTPDFMDFVWTIAGGLPVLAVVL